MKLFAFNDRVAWFTRSKREQSTPFPSKLLDTLLHADTWSGMKRFLELYADCSMYCDCPLSSFEMELSDFRPTVLGQLSSPKAKGFPILTTETAVQLKANPPDEVVCQLELARIFDLRMLLIALLVNGALANGEHCLGGRHKLHTATETDRVNHYKWALHNSEYSVDEYRLNRDAQHPDSDSDWLYVFTPPFLKSEFFESSGLLDFIDGRYIIPGFGLHKDALPKDFNYEIPFGSVVHVHSTRLPLNDFFQRDLCGAWVEAIYNGVGLGRRRAMLDRDYAPGGLKYSYERGMIPYTLSLDTNGEIDAVLLEYAKELIASHQVGICPVCGNPVNRSKSTKRAYCSRSCVTNANEQRKVMAYTFLREGMSTDQVVHLLGDAYRDSIVRWQEDLKKDGFIGTNSQLEGDAIVGTKES